MRMLDFDDGFSSEDEPTQGVISANRFMSFASDAAFVTAKGSAAANADTYYNSADDAVRIFRAGAWEYFGQPGVTGSRGTATAIVAGTGIAFAGKGRDNIWFVKGNGGVATTVTANPAIAAGAYVGQRLRLVGRDDTATLTVPNGLGTSMNGDWTGGADSVIDFEWDGTNWREESRNDL